MGKLELVILTKNQLKSYIKKEVTKLLGATDKKNAIARDIGYIG